MLVGSLGAALGLYAAAFMGVHDDIDPFLRDIHQQSESAAWAAGAAACIAAVLSTIERLIKLWERRVAQRHRRLDRQGMARAGPLWTA